MKRERKVIKLYYKIKIKKEKGHLKHKSSSQWENKMHRGKRVTELQELQQYNREDTKKFHNFVYKVTT